MRLIWPIGNDLVNSAFHPLWKRSSQQLDLNEYRMEEDITTSLNGVQLDLSGETGSTNIYIMPTKVTKQDHEKDVMLLAAGKSHHEYTLYPTHSNRRLQRKYSDDVRGMLLGDIPSVLRISCTLIFHFRL